MGTTRARQRVVAITAARKRGVNWTREDRVIHSPFWWCSTFFSVLLPLLAQTFYWQGLFKELFLSLHKALVNLKRTSSQERTKALQAVADRLVFNFVFWLDPKSKHKPSPLFVSSSVCYLFTAKPVNLGGWNFTCSLNSLVRRLKGVWRWTPWPLRLLEAIQL